MTPLVSILLPVYNGAKYISDTINSVLEQSYENFEFIIINDGSTDNTEQIINTYSDSRIIYIKNQENLKLIKTLNKGIKLAKGKYIARIDADDIMHKNRLLKQVDFLEKNENYIIVGSAVKLINLNNLNEDNYIEYYQDNDDIIFSMIFYCPIIHPSTLIRKSTLILNELEFDHNFIHAEDYELWTRMVKFGKIANLSENLTFYRLHNEQISQKNLELQKIQMQKIQDNYLKKMLPEFSEIDKKHLFEPQFNNTNLVSFLKILRKFNSNKAFNGPAKKRYILKISKEKILETNMLSFKELIYTFSSPYFWKNSVTIKQRVAFFMKFFKSNS